MPLKTEGSYRSDWLRRVNSQLFPGYNTEEVTIVSGQNLKEGEPVGKITASGKYATYDDDNIDGTETVAGIMVGAVDASGGDKPGVILKRGPAIVSKAGLQWSAGNDAADKTAGLVDLAAFSPPIIAGEDV